MNDVIVVAVVNGGALVLGASTVLLKQAKTTTIIEKIHTLVNSQMSVQMRVSMLLAKQVVALTQDPDAKLIAQKVADEAERLYNEQVKKQSVVDSMEK